MAEKIIYEKCGTPHWLKSGYELVRIKIKGHEDNGHGYCKVKDCKIRHEVIRKINKA